MAASKKILIVDDEERNIKILAVLCGHHGHTILKAFNGRQAVDQARAHKPDIILMDVMMPEMDGFAATEILKADEATRHIPIIIITALDSREDRLRGIQAGADDFLNKPIDAEEFSLRLRNNLRNKEFHDFLENHAHILEQQVAERTEQLRRGYIDTIYRLVLTSEYKDEDTGSHIKRISHYTREIAERLGMPDDFSDRIFYAAPMHDIGKVATPDRILLKDGPLTPEEWEIMRNHTVIGAKILEGSDSPYLKMAVDIARYHHERWDGTGYPRGLAGEDIPLTARIMNICDQYDAIRSKRPYKESLNHRKTVEIITQGDGRTSPNHFDPVILETFVQLADRFNDIFESYQDEEDI